MFESSSCLDKAVMFGSVVVEIKKFVSFPGEKNTACFKRLLMAIFSFQ